MAWEVQYFGLFTKVYDDRRFLRALRHGRISGDTPIRRLGDTEWKPLRERPDLIAELEGQAGRGRGPRLARLAAVQGLLMHVAVFVGVSELAGLPPDAVKWWGFAVAVHAFGTVMTVLKLRARETAALPAAQQTVAVPASRPVSQPNHDSWPSRSAADDPFLGELDAALEALREASRGSELDFDKVRDSVREAGADLRRRHLALSQIADPAARERLTRERDETISRAGAETDPRTIEALQHQARSVAERLGGMEDAARAAARLDARERTLLHQIESMRASLLQAQAEARPAPDLTADLTRLQKDLKAEAEIENHLARGRMQAERH